MTNVIDFLSKVLPITVTSLVAVLAVIAPLTKSDYDNKALDGLRWFEDKILSILFPGLVKQTEVEEA